MKPEANCPRPVLLRSLASRLRRRLSVAACRLPSRFAMASSPGAEPATAKQGERAQVYVYRGLMNVCCMGMDEIATELQRYRIPATVYNHLSWSSVADSAADDYKSGKVRT